jgi:hypothetical protein
MKRLALCTLILGFAVQTFMAQQPGKGSNANAAVRSQSDHLGDDDGGMVQIVPADVPAVAPDKAQAAPVMKSMQQVNLFLGTAWAEPVARSREGVLNDLTYRLGELRNNNVTLLPAISNVEDFSDLTKTRVNDLFIQRKLTELLNNGALPAPKSETIYVVFLAAGIKSSLGGHKAGIDYAAYHSLLHTEAGEVRYVVVPFNDDAERQAAAATRALILTVFNPKE